MAFLHQILVPPRHDDDQVFRPVRYALAAEAGVHVHVAGRVEHVEFVLGGLRTRLAALKYLHVASSAGADAAAGVVNVDPRSVGNVEDAAFESGVPVRNFRGVHFKLFPLAGFLDVDRDLERFGRPLHFGLIDVWVDAAHDLSSKFQVSSQHFAYSQPSRSKSGSKRSNRELGTQFFFACCHPRTTTVGLSDFRSGGNSSRLLSSLYWRTFFCPSRNSSIGRRSEFTLVA